MNITDELLDKISHLAKLQLEGKEREQIKADFARILEFVEQLQEVDTDGVEPLIHITQEWNHLREDNPQAPLDRDAALDNAPDHDGQFYKVPKVVKK